MLVGEGELAKTMHVVVDWISGIDD